MATEHLSLTRTPTDAVTAVPLTTGSTYGIHNPGPTDFYFAEAASAPAADTPARNLVRKGDRVPWEIHSSDGLYFWADRGAPVAVFDVAK